MKTRNTTSDWPETKRKLVDAGVALMRASGYNATTVDHICAAAGVTKGGFFHYFKSKEDLAKAALHRFSDAQIEDIDAAPFRQLADPLARVYGRLDFIQKSVDDRGRLTKGCLIGTLAQELSFTHPDLRQICEAAFSRVAQDFQKDLEEAKSRYAPEAAFSPRNLAMLYVSIFQGSLMLAKAADANTVIAENITQYRSYLQSLFGQPSRALEPQSV